MALKTKYAKKDEIPKGAEEHYTERDGEWHLDADFEDTGALKRAKDHEARDRKKAEDRVKALETELQAKEQEVEDIRKGAIPKSDVEALEKSLKTKYEKTIADKDTALGNARTQIEKHVRDATVERLAAELFDKNAPIGRPHLAGRLKTVEENGEYVLKVLDKDGQVSAMTTDELKKEFLQDKTFAGILVGSRANGGGANGGNGGGGAPNPGTTGSVDLAKAKPSDLVAHINAKKTG